MFEDDEIIDEPNPERLEAIHRAGRIFIDVCQMNPEAPQPTEEDVIQIINGILRRNGDLTDSLQYTIEWRAILGRREEASRQEAEAEAREEARRQAIADYKLPANRAETMSELRAGRTSASPAEFVPAREFTEAEKSAMSADTFRRDVLGHTSIEDRQTRSNAPTVKEELTRLILAGKIDNRAGVRKVWSLKFSQEELAAQEKRAREIAADKAERRKLEQEWRNKK